MNGNNYKNIFVCPECKRDLSIDSGRLICAYCSLDYSLIDGIPDFRKKDQYWCNVNRQKMQELNKLARSSGDWLGAAKRVVPEYAAHFIPFDRADMQFLWPCTKDSRILDAGSMWGGISIPAAQFHGQVYAVDKTKETLEFLNIRAKQMGLDNIQAVASGLEKLPFPDNFFDLVVLSGVLEWVAFGEELVLEKHWRRFGRGVKTGQRKRYADNPKEVQLKVLQEMRRVIKPGGCLYLAIENRVGYIYLVGYPDDHMNLPFICFMPRALANLVTKITLNCEYRTYVYTIPECKTLLRRGGFANIDFYGIFTHYINPKEAIPLPMIENLKGKIISTKRGINKILLSLIPKKMLPWLSPSIVAFATKGSGPKNDPRLVQLLKKEGLLNGSSSAIRLMKCDSRPGNELTVNYWVYTDEGNKPKYFCKVCRSNKATAVLRQESENIRILNNLLKESRLNSHIPKLLHYGTTDGITFMVTEFIDARKSSFNFNSRLKYKLKDLDTEIKEAIRFLAQFQKNTITKQIEAVSYLVQFLEDKKMILQKRGLLTENVNASIDKLKEEIKELGEFTMPLCAQHGDYDFFYNILFHEEGLRITDFEHFEQQALPFLDLATLIFNPLVVSHEYKKSKRRMSKILDKYELRKFLNDWLSLYEQLTGMPRKLLRFLPALAALEQRTKDYPSWRDPLTFPINAAFEDLLRVRILDKR